MKGNKLVWSGAGTMKRRVGLLLVLLVMMTVLVACGASAAMNDAQTSFDREESFGGEFAFGAPEMAAEAPQEAAMADMAYLVTEEGMAAVTDGFATGNAVQPSPDSRLIIRTGDIGVVVEDTEASLAQIAAMAESNGGWVVNSYVFQAGEDAMSGNITIRVPAEGFQSALDAISAMAVEVQSLSTSGQDVTEEYVDLDARLGNLEATADRVRGFLDETRNVEEALAVNQELSRLEGEIEVIKGRMQYLSEWAAFSTITANLTPDILAQPVQIGGWEPVGVAKEALEALINGLQGIANVLIWLAIYVLPIALIILIPLFFLVRYLLRRSRAHQEAQATPETPVATE